MTYETYPLSALAIAEENVRHTSQPDDGIPALAQMIADTGLQQPLCGYKKGRTKLLIYDGRRRLLALQHLAQTFDRDVVAALAGFCAGVRMRHLEQHLYAVVPCAVQHAMRMRLKRLACLPRLCALSLSAAATFRSRR